MPTGIQREQKYQVRAKPGSKGGGKFYRIVVAPKEKFVQYRTQDVGRAGHIERVAGLRYNGDWVTQAWLISKEDAHIARTWLVADSNDAREVFDTFRSRPRRVKADIFAAEETRPKQRKESTKLKAM